MKTLHRVNMKTGKLIIHTENDKEYADKLLKELEGLKWRIKALEPKAKHHGSIMQNINDEFHTMKLSKKEAGAIIEKKYKKELSEMRRFEGFYNDVVNEINDSEKLLGR